MYGLIKRATDLYNCAAECFFLHKQQAKRLTGVDNGSTICLPHSIPPCSAFYNTGIDKFMNYALYTKLAMLVKSCILSFFVLEKNINGHIHCNISHVHTGMKKNTTFDLSVFINK